MAACIRFIRQISAERVLSATMYALDIFSIQSRPDENELYARSAAVR